ncbi:MAG: hypothetical protein GWO20_02475 [Candidatus Korarchaeota archaeon]|nr:hypothetical protein [Candidatus Korarchaeota archaeon]
MVRRNYLGFGVVIFLLGIIVTAMTAVGLHIESMVTVGVLAIIGGLAGAIYGAAAKPPLKR